MSLARNLGFSGGALLWPLVMAGIACSGPPKPVPAPPAPEPAAVAPTASVVETSSAALPDAGQAPAPAGPTRVGAVDDVQAMILDDTRVYFFADDVKAIPKVGGEVTNLSAKSEMRLVGSIAPGDSPRLAQSGDRIFLSNSYDIQQPSTPVAIVYWVVYSTLASVFKNGDVPAFANPGNAQVYGVAADAKWVYWLQSGQVSRVIPAHLPFDRLMKMPVTGGKSSAVAAKLGSAIDFVIDASDAYVATVTKKQASVLRVPLAGGVPTTIWAGEAWPEERTTLAVDATHVYFPIADRLVRVDKSARAAGAAADVVKGFDAVSLGSARAYAIDEHHVYWTSASAVMRANKDGSAPPERIASGKNLGAIALDASNVFYVSAESKDEYWLMKLAK